MKKLNVKYIYFGLIILLSLPYFGNGYAGIMHNKELVDIVSSMSIFSPYTNILLYIQGSQDILIGLLILFYHGKYKPFLFVFAALWPIIPNAMIEISGVTTGEGAEWVEVIGIMILSYISFVYWKKYKKLK